MILFVVLEQVINLDDKMIKLINQSIKNGVSVRFIPNEIVRVDQIPRTLSGKKLEIPIKKLFLGGSAEKVVNKDSMVNPESFNRFIELANLYLANSDK